MISTSWPFQERTQNTDLNRCSDASKRTQDTKTCDKLAQWVDNAVLRSCIAAQHWGGDRSLGVVSTFLSNPALESWLHCDACNSLAIGAIRMKLELWRVQYVHLTTLSSCCCCSGGSCAIARDSTTVNLADSPQQRKAPSWREGTTVSLSEGTQVFQGQEDTQQVTHKHKSTEESQKKQIIKLFCCCCCAAYFLLVYSSAVYVCTLTCTAVLSTMWWYGIVNLIPQIHPSKPDPKTPGRTRVLTISVMGINDHRTDQEFQLS